MAPAKKTPVEQTSEYKAFVQYWTDNADTTSEYPDLADTYIGKTINVSDVSHIFGTSVEKPFVVDDKKLDGVHRAVNISKTRVSIVKSGTAPATIKYADGTGPDWEKFQQLLTDKLLVAGTTFPSNIFVVNVPVDKYGVPKKANMTKLDSIKEKKGGFHCMSYCPPTKDTQASFTYNMYGNIMGYIDVPVYNDNLGQTLAYKCAVITA